MSCYDDARDAWHSMSEKDTINKYRADEARERFCKIEKELSETLLKRYLEKKGISAVECHNPNASFWDNKTKEFKRLLKKIKKRGK